MSIAVTDINDNNPVFTNEQPVIFRVAENQNAVFVGAVSVSLAMLAKFISFTCTNLHLLFSWINMFSLDFI